MCDYAALPPTYPDILCFSFLLLVIGSGLASIKSKVSSDTMTSRVLQPRSQDQASSREKNIIFFHPDLGIGGAERLVIDAAVGLQNIGHNVVIFTSHCDHSHCFDEARDGDYSLEDFQKGPSLSHF